MPHTLTKRAMMFLSAASIAAFLLVVLTTTAQAQQGYVIHIVQRGEWLYFIAPKYCTSPAAIYAMNSHVIGRNPNDVKPGMRLTVRNECVTTVQPTNPVAQPSLTIKTPKPDDSLGSTFIVTGTGAALPQGLVVVRALDAAGKELAKMTVAMAADSTPARAGTWYAQLNVSVRSSRSGYIEATVPGAEVRRTVVIQYQAAPTPETGGGGSQGSTVVFYRQGQCQVRPAKDAAVYEYPNGLVKGYVSDALVDVTQRVVDAGSVSWYQIADPYAAPNPGYWVPRTNLAFVGVGCN